MTRFVCKVPALVLSLTTAIALFASTTYAQDKPLTEREQMLLQKVEDIEKRLEELEKGNAAKQAVQNVTQQQGQAELEKRVTGVEQKMTEQPKRSATDLRAFWKDGLRFETEDGAFKLKVGGRIQYDWAWLAQDEELKIAVGDEQDGAEFRRARIELQGDIYENVFYKAQYDFAGDNGDAKFKDVWVGMKDIPYVGTITLGHRKEPFSLEQLTSSNHITFLERSLADAFAPERNLGVMVNSDAFDKRLAWAFGFFKDVNDFPSDDDSDEDQGVAFTARVSGVPWYADEGRKLLHLGVAYSHRNPDGAAIRYRQRPEAHLGNYYVDTGAYEGYRITDARADDIDLYSLESALVLGPFSMQGEYMQSTVDTTFAGSRDFDGWYLFASYFLTGENRNYKLGEGVFDRLKPKHNFSLGEEKGWGAWEVALRYSTIDLDDGIIRGGQEDDWTVGLNWYLNPNTRVMLNYVLANVEHDLYEGGVNTFETRFQVDF